MEKHKHAVVEKRRARDALKYAFIEMPEDIGKWLVVGVVAGGIIASIPFNIVRHIPSTCSPLYWFLSPSMYAPQAPYL